MKRLCFFDATPDRYFLRLDEICSGIAESHFNLKDRYSESDSLYNEWRALRIKLLADRRDIRARLGEAFDSNLMEKALQIHGELIRVSAHCKWARDQYNEKTRTLLS